MKLFIDTSIKTLSAIMLVAFMPVHGMTTEDRARMHTLNTRLTDISREDIIIATEARIPALFAQLMAIGQPNNAPLQQQMHNDAVQAGTPAPQDVHIQMGTPVQISLAQPAVHEQERLIPALQIIQNAENAALRKLTLKNCIKQNILCIYKKDHTYHAPCGDKLYCCKCKPGPCLQEFKGPCEVKTSRCCVLTYSFLGFGAAGLLTFLKTKDN